MFQAGPPQGAQRQIAVNELDTIQRKCSCGCELFDVVCRIRVLPAISPKNPTGKDQPFKVETYVCRECGLEIGKTKTQEDQQNG